MPSDPYSHLRDQYDELHDKLADAQSRIAEIEAERDEARQKVREWVLSSSGREEIAAIILQSERAQSELTDARRVDPNTLNVPVNFDVAAEIARLIEERTQARRERDEARQAAKTFWQNVQCENVHHRKDQYHKEPPCPVIQGYLDRWPWLEEE